MHILMVNNIYPPIAAGGAELMVAWLSEGLVALGHRVTVVSTCAPHMEPYPVEEKNGVTVIRFFPRNFYWNFERQGQSRYRRALWHLRDAWNRDAARAFGQILSVTAPDIVHTHLIDGFSAAIWHEARLAGVPVIHTAHDYHLLCPRAFLLTRDWRICRKPALGCQLYRLWHLRTSREVDLFVSPSQFLLSHHQDAGMATQQTAVVPNGIPLPQLTEDGERPPRLLMLTRLTEEKGVRVVLAAMALLPPTLPIELVVAGRGPLETEIQAAADADPRIQFVGYVTGEQKATLLASARYLVIPSLWFENAPVAVIEAAAYGLGVIASRIGGLPELVRQGKTGILFEPGNAEELAAIISGLISGEIVLEDQVAATADLVANHSVDRMVDAYLGHYNDVLEMRTQSAA